MAEIVCSLDPKRYNRMHPKLREVCQSFMAANNVPENQIYLIEITVEGNALISLYLKNEEGKRYYDPAINGAAFTTYECKAPLELGNFLEAVMYPRDVIYGSES